MTLKELRQHATEEVVEAIGTDSVWAGYRFVERELETIGNGFDVKLAGEALRRYRYWMGWAREELVSSQTGEARSSLVDARFVQLQAQRAILAQIGAYFLYNEHRGKLANLRLYDWDSASVIYLVEHFEYGEVLFELASEQPLDLGENLIALENTSGEVRHEHPVLLLEGSARMLSSVAACPLFPNSLEHGFLGGHAYHIFTQTPGETLASHYARREAIPAEVFDRFMKRLVDDVPEFVALPGKLALDPGTLALQDGELVVWRLRGSCASAEGFVQVIDPGYAPRSPLNPAYALLAMRHEAGTRYTRIHNSRTAPRFELDVVLANEVRTAQKNHPIHHLAGLALPLRDEDLAGALGVRIGDGVLHDAPLRTCAALVSPDHAVRMRGVGRYLPIENNPSTPAARLVESRDALTGARVLIAGLKEPFCSGDEYTSIYMEAARREATALERCKGTPGLLEVIEHGEGPGNAYLTVFGGEKGEPLRAMLEPRHTKMTFSNAQAIIAQACDALEALHCAGCVHGNIKPETILVRVEGDELRVTIAHSGIARDVGQPPEPSGVALGTMGYMAPEQISCTPATPRSDIFSLACVMVECLTGSPAFSPNALSILSDVQRSPESIGGLRLIGNDRPSLRIVLERALAASSEQRFASCAEFARKLRALSTTSPPPSQLASFAPTPEERNNLSPHPAPLAPAPILRHTDANEFVAQRYRIGEILREDMRSTLYRATDTITGETVEVDIVSASHQRLHPRLEEISRASWRALLSRQRHHVQRIRTFGQTSSGALYSVHDNLSDVPTLWEIMDNGPLLHALRWRILDGIILALDELSDLEHGILHPGIIHVEARALGPARVTISGVELMSTIGDLGEERPTFHAGALVHYIAPERITGLPSRTLASDMWNLGALAYILWTGSPPFGSGTIYEVAMRMIREAPRPFHEALVGARESAFEQAVLQCLARDPEDRFLNFAEARRALMRAETNL